MPVGPHYGFGLYVHWPYCAKICPYCDFNVYAAKQRDTAPLLQAITDDIAAHKALMPDHPSLDSVFLGGGTPSLLGAAEIGAILSAAETAFGLKQGAEITLEANPNDASPHAMEGWASAGVNRLSIGIQSFSDKGLELLGRDHSAAQAITTARTAPRFFNSVSLDLIYAWPGQTRQEWERDLETALSLKAPHLSLYELTIEERTAFGKAAARGTLIPKADDEQADFYELTQAICTAAGLPAYEVSNHAAAPPYQSVHNHIYWNSGDWIGVGPGAHGRLTLEGQRYATTAARRPADYIAAPRPEQTPLSQHDAALELLAMGLRPAAGFDRSRFHALTGTPLQPDKRAELIKSGHLIETGQTLALTPDGRLLADYIAGQLAP